MNVPSNVVYHQHDATLFAYALDADGDIIGSYRKRPVVEGEAPDEWCPEDFDWENAEKRLTTQEIAEHARVEMDPADLEPDPQRERYLEALKTVLRKGELPADPNAWKAPEPTKAQMAEIEQIVKNICEAGGEEVEWKQTDPKEWAAGRNLPDGGIIVESRFKLGDDWRAELYVLNADGETLDVVTF
jgi:hypothetical protein